MVELIVEDIVLNSVLVNIEMKKSSVELSDEHHYHYSYHSHSHLFGKK